MIEVHAQLARTIVLFYAAVGLWGLFLAVRHIPLGQSYRGTLVIAELVGILQAVVGIILLVMGRYPANPIHFLYGASVVVTLPLVHQFLAGKRLTPPLAFGIGCLFMAGLAIRAISTGATAQ